ncbi:two-component system OmpR family response regulator [Kitasatospora sp. MAP12-15]|uniref:response regulator transcription factor n=1 Tax=unclassified Kitasatospora TaxID=2633591 RepID=UPI002476CBCC|nr:response regulator transcription factor [Kitasatospora sp. MAP12-44]MDH6110493.1 two-component system OmpR family response regulator [Kitasatospora sp. MAP12-44]
MHLLMVEDEERLAQSLSQGLRAEGYAVDVTGDGLSGLELARSGSYAAIVLDLMLPGMNGFRVCEELRRDENPVPILMLTAKNGEYDEAEALDCGADDFLSKPFSYVVLTARLRALLRRGGAARPAVLTAGNLRIDPAARRCVAGETVIKLTNKEFGVLECLLRRPDQAVPKSEILDAVWDSAFRGDVNIVEVYIAALRRKLHTAAADCVIETVRGIGYRVVSDAC